GRHRAREAGPGPDPHHGARGRDRAARRVGVRHDPQRDDHERRPAGAHRRPGDQREHRAVAHQRVPAHDGRDHPDHRVPAAAVHPAPGVHGVDVAVQRGHPGRGSGARVRRAAGRARGAGVRHRRHAAAAHDLGDAAGARGAPRSDDGHDHRRHRRRAGRGPDDLRARPVGAGLALDVLDRPAGRAGGPGRGHHAAAGAGADPARAAGPAVGGAVRRRVRRAGVRPDRGGRVGAGRGAAAALDPGPRRRGRAGRVREPPAAPAAPRPRPARPAPVHPPPVRGVGRAGVAELPRPVRRADPAAAVPPGRAGRRPVHDRAGRAAGRSGDGPDGSARRPAVRPRRRAPARRPGRDRDVGGAVAVHHAGRRLAAGGGGRHARADQRGPVADGHPPDDRGAGLAAAGPVPARQRDPVHIAAGGGRGRHGAVRDGVDDRDGHPGRRPRRGRHARRVRSGRRAVTRRDRRVAPGARKVAVGRRAV
ncbi:MAG: Uncharacterized MFS-type transporter, partial [uncultured Pseudonocardia sp.]